MSAADPRLLGWLLRRLAGGALVVLTVVSLVWGLFELGGTDACTALVGVEDTNVQAATTRALYGCDLPAAERFLHQLRQALTLDFGDSAALRGPVREVILRRLLSTLALTVPALVLGVAAGFGLATVSRGEGHGARALRVLGAIVWGVPPVFLALGLMVVALRLGWPATCTPSGGIWPADLRCAPLPMGALILAIAAGHARFFREILHAEAAQPHILALRARGLTPAQVERHVLRNALGPILALIGLDLPWLVAGAVVVEGLSNWPGIGWLLADAVSRQDTSVVTACTMVITTTVVVGGVLGRLGQALVDPRVRL